MALQVMALLPEVEDETGWMRNVKMSPSAEMTEQAERELPEEILEMVIAKVPFPSLFKARILSKCWNSKFPLRVTSLNSPSPLTVSLEASAFQSQFTVNSAKWGVYAPVFVNWTSNQLLAFDRDVPHWFAPLPPNMWQNQHENRNPFVRIAGALVLVGRWGVRTFSVGNVITGSYRQLTLPPETGVAAGPTTGLVGSPLCLIAVDCHSYKLFALYFDSKFTTEKHWSCFMYDSNSQLWTSTVRKRGEEQAFNRLWFFSSHYAYLNGKVYFLGYYDIGVTLLKLVSYDLNTSWTIFGERFASDVHFDDYPCDSGVFSCKDKLIVVVTSTSTIDEGDAIAQEEKCMDVYSIREKSIQIFQLDIQSLQLALLSEGPPGTMAVLEISESDKINRPQFRLSADANFIYFGWDRLPSSVLTFDLNRQEWSTIPIPFVSSTPDFNSKRHNLDWINGAFEPGLNPFVLP